MEQKLRIGKPNVNIIEASGEITITENGTYDVRQYKDAKVNVSGNNEYIRSLIDRSIVEAPSEMFKGVSTVGSGLFYNCLNLTNVILPYNILDISSAAFSYCNKLTNITLSQNTYRISTLAFNQCSSLESIIIPASVDVIGSQAFASCDKLTIYCEASEKPENWDENWNLLNYSNNTRVPVVWNYLSESYTYDNITYRLSDTYSTASLMSITADGETDTDVIILDKVLKNSKEYTVEHIPGGFLALNNTIESLTIPFIGEYKDIAGKTNLGHIFGASFSTDNDEYVPTSLKEVIITGGTRIGEDAFYNCSSLTSITIPGTIKNIGAAFTYCDSLTNIYYSGSLEDWCNIEFSDSYSNPMIWAENFYMLDNGEWKEITKIEIPGTVTNIGNHIFRGFDNITEVILPSTIVSIGSSAFADCSALKEIIIPNNVQSINTATFSYCTSLIKVTIPKNVKTIGNSAFLNCEKLQNIVFNGTVAEWNSITLDSFWNRGVPAKYVQCSDGQVQL